MKGKGIKYILMFLSFILGILVTILVLYLIGILNFEKNSEDNNEVKIVKLDNNFSMITSSNCVEGCNENVVLEDNKKVDFFADNKSLKLGDKVIFSLDNSDETAVIEQVSVYNDIIIGLVNYDITRNLMFFDFDGNLIKDLNFFNDEVSRLFFVSLKYDDNEFFHVDEEGVISFIGTKSFQGNQNIYINDFAYQVDLCSSDNNISDTEIVSGVFELSYLGNNHFSEIRFVDSRSNVSDVRKCNN